jgi:site-specific DNA recombinase
VGYGIYQEVKKRRKENEMKTAAIYCRVSTEDQEREGTSLQTQLEASLKYCQNRDYQVAYHFSETYSGLTLERPKLNELRELVRNKQTDVIVIYCLDRLSRDPTHGVILTQELERHGVKLEAVTEDVDNSELGKLISYIRGFASKLEAEKIRERTTRGKRAYVQQGKLPIGTGKGLYGYKWDKETKKRIPVEFEVKVVQRIFTMLAEGKGYFNIARTLNEIGIPTKTGSKWSARTLYNMAGNPGYVGMTYYGQTQGSRRTKVTKKPESDWVPLPGITPPIISKELFDWVQEIRRRNRELHKVKTKQEYLLRGHAYCGHCGSHLVGSLMGHRFRYYHCRGTYTTATRAKTCDARYIRADCLEGVVWQSIRKVLEHPDVVLAGVKGELENERKTVIQGVSLDAQIQKLTKRVKNYDSEEKRLVQLFRYGEFNQDTILDELNRLKSEREADKATLHKLKADKERIAVLESAEVKLSEYCERLKRDLDSASYQDKRDILDMLAIKVTATAQAIDIDGVIPLEPMFTQTSGESPDITHHWTNMGITT